MVKKDISYYNEEIKFNFRVSIVAYKDNKILLQKCDKDPYYSLIGGRVSLGESTMTAIKREILEEIGILVDDKELVLIDIIENFFTYNQTYYHELLFIYRLNNEQLYKMDNFKTLDKDESINKWIDIKDIEKLDIRPNIIKSIYKNKVLEHRIIDE